MTFCSLEEALTAYRGMWKMFSRENIDLRTAASIQQGIAERIRPALWNERVGNYLSDSFDFLCRCSGGEEKIDNPETIIELVRPALGLGLNVQTPKKFEQISQVEGLFGVIQEIKRKGTYTADISFYLRESYDYYHKKNEKIPLLESADVPVSLILPSYCRAGACVCWVEYKFRDGGAPSEGNYEPGGCYVEPAGRYKRTKYER